MNHDILCGKLSYYGFFNYKKGDGFRDNSNFTSNNFYVHLGYKISKKTKLSGEISYLNYSFIFNSLVAWIF